VASLKLKREGPLEQPLDQLRSTFRPVGPKVVCCCSDVLRLYDMPLGLQHHARKDEVYARRALVYSGVVSAENVSRIAQDRGAGESTSIGQRGTVSTPNI
jgi:hypothetical protein